MVDYNNALTPQTGFLVSLSSRFSNFSDEVLIDFYQPILGPQALGLFYALKANVTKNPVISNRIAHTHLLTRLNIDIKQLYQARVRLEALGLVRSFETSDQLGDVVVYELQPTLTPQQFIDDDLLSVLLLEAIGEHSYDSLVSDSIAYQYDTNKLEAVTKSFFDSYHINQNDVTKLPDTIRESRQKFVVSQANEHDILPQSDFDFKLLLQLLSSQPIDTDKLLSDRQLIENEHLIYGIDEPQMARLIMQATSLTNNQLDAKQLKRIISASYQQVTTNNNNQQLSNESIQADELKQLSNNEQELIKACQSYSPIEFLQTLMVQKNGFVTSGEEYILRDLIGRKLFAPGVVNMLIYYVLQERGQATLTKNLIDTVANSWSQSKIKTPVEALNQIKNHGRKKPNNKRAAGGSYTNRRQVKEKLPDWAKEDYQNTEQKATPAQVAQLKAQIEKQRKQQSREG
ncbi:DnaD domain protein [Paucilactobacillus kaifaensis]|uniref:DnaD domain protein n=1 Tax=Paucilactobacillus kaifaensis TaxID=2559921 RepID=UPI0010F61370|nr:DnaD domain protein [Paucilactobacillus kaifaensis]